VHGDVRDGDIQRSIDRRFAIDDYPKSFDTGLASSMMCYSESPIVCDASIRRAVCGRRKLDFSIFQSEKRRTFITRPKTIGQCPLPIWRVKSMA
jgi:hypothetical protein